MSFNCSIERLAKGGPFRQKNNIIPVPQGPGLGAVTDQERLNRWHQHYLENGPLDHFYSPEEPGQFK